MDVTSIVAQRIIDQLEKGVIPWHKPWIGSDFAVKHSNGQPYSLLNQILVGDPGEYASFKQITEAGGRVKKGAKGRVVVFWKLLDVDDSGVPGEPDSMPVTKTIPYLRYSHVFRIGPDTEGIEPKYIKDPATALKSHAHVIADAQGVFEDYLARSGCKFRSEAGNKAYYSQREDEIVLPVIEQFEDSAEYYSTAFHEAVHSTGHSSRLDRFSTSAPAYFGSEDYSKEELIAEIGSACILNTLGVESDHSFRNSAAYIQNWLKALKNDKSMVISASSRAQKAVEMILHKTSMVDSDPE